MVTKQGDGTAKAAVKNESGATLMGEGGFDRGTGLYPMAEPSVEYTQHTDNSSTGAVPGNTEPQTYEAHLDMSPTGAVTGATGPTSHYQYPATAPAPVQIEPKSAPEDTETEAQAGEVVPAERVDQPVRRGPGRPRKTGGQ